MVCWWQRLRKIIPVGGTLTSMTLVDLQIASGNLLFAREAHYQPLTHLSFTSDEAFLFSGGDDAVIHTWRVLDLVDFNLRSEEIVPIQSWNEHTLAVTGIVCGSGTAMSARVYTSSMDKTVKVAILILRVDKDLGYFYPVTDDYDLVSKRSNCIGA